MDKAKYLQEGKNIDYKNGGTDMIAAGEIVVIGSRIGVAGGDIPGGETGAVVTEGVWELPKTAEEAISVGDMLYFDAATKKVTKTASKTVESAAVPNPNAGLAVAAAAASDDTVHAKID